MWITEIRLKNYRAFAEEVVVRIPEGSHLLVYGENGSGKSSLFRGVKEFFATAQSNQLAEFIRNRWLEDELPEDIGQVAVRFDKEIDFKWLSEKDLYYHNIPFIQQTSRLSDFVSYQDFIPLHIHQNKIDEYRGNILFRLLGEQLLSSATVIDPYTRGTEITFSQLRQKVSQQLSLIDFQLPLTVEGSEDLKQKISGIISEVNDIYYDLVREVNIQANNFLHKYFDHNLSINLSPGSYTGQIFTDGPVSSITLCGGEAVFRPIYAGKRIDNYHDFLNEARLSSFTLCFRLAAIHLLPAGPDDHRLLFLDDIFTGLDMNNRLPLLRLIKEEFMETEVAPFQVGIATHDRSWYELAEKWFKNEKIPIKTLEMYARSGEGPREPDVPVLLDRSSDPYEQAIAHFAIGDYTACAVNLRKAAERVAKGLVTANKHYRHHTDGTKEEQELATLMTLAHNRLQDKIDDATIFDRFSRIRGRILNPYAHDDGNAPFFRREMEEGIEVLRELRRYAIVRLLEAKDGVEISHTFEGRTAIILIMENLEALHKDGTTLSVLNANCRVDKETKIRNNLHQAIRRAWLKTHRGEKLADTEAVYNQFILRDGRSLYDLLST